MKAIHIKLLRDLVRHRWQSVTIALVMACGVSTFVMSLSMLDSLSGTLSSYYERNRFADVFAHLKRAPLGLEGRIAEIPGVSYVQTRVQERITLDMPGLAEPASGRIVSLPGDPRSGLNLIYLRAGRFPEDTRSREVLVSQRFAESHDLRPGDSVEAILNGRMESLRVVGIALSPEFIYLISPGSVLPDNRRFGVFWMLRDEMEAAFDMEGAFNDVLISTSPNATESVVIDRLDGLTERYGGLGAYGRSDQASHKFLENELSELRRSTLVAPVIFLGVAAFLLNIVLSRMIATQREQIAALKALGYSRREIGLHYAGFVSVITVLAIIAGSFFGAWLGRGLTAIYIEFFDFPSFEYVLRMRVVLAGAVVSAIAAGAGVSRSLRAAMRLPPAEAMRPKAPPSYRPTALERLGVYRAVPVALRMIIRQLERQPVRTGLSVLGVALATAVLVLGNYSKDALDFLLEFQFERVQQYDVDVVLSEQTDDAALSTIRAMPGVGTMEPYRPLAVRIRSGHVERRVGIIGLSRDDGLYNLLDVSGRHVTLPARGLVLSSVLAEVLGVGVGDRVLVEALEGRRPEFTAEVSGLIDDFSGLSVYMRLDEMNRMMREAHTIGGVYLLTDEARAGALYGELHDTPQVVAVNVKSATVENFRDTVTENMSIMRPFMVGFSVVIAFGVIYNSTRISLSERSRDLATLRVLGYSGREVSAMQLGELVLITLLAIPVGLALGYLFAWLAAESVDSELIRIPFVIAPSTYGFAVIVILISTVISGMVVHGRLNRLDLISVLKSRE